MDANPDLRGIAARYFIDHCKDKFGWRDLSRDVIMDVGCGENGYCGKAILEKFPDVRAIIGIDMDPKAVFNFRMRNRTRMECEVSDIEKREFLRVYEAKITKVISAYAFHQVEQKEEAFRNIYRILKPGGEAAVLFVIKSLIYEWLTEVLKNPTWKAAYQRHYAEDLFRTETDQYKEMVERIGFQVIECSEAKRVVPYPSDQVCKEALYRMSGEAFNLPPELVEEFKEDCFQILLKLGGRDAQGKPCYRATELTLLLVKPTEGAVVGAKETPGS